MQSSIKSKLQARIIAGLAIVACVLAFSNSLAEDDEQEPEASNASDYDFTRLDTTEAINNYRDELHREAIDGLASSNLSDEHQELLANAIAAMYLGVPLSSYTESEREESSDEEPTERSLRWVITADGRIRHESESMSISHDLNTMSPFVYFPPLPINAASGRVLVESDTEALFVFDFDMPMDMGEEDFSRLADKMKWVAEITVNKHDQSPKSFVLKLEKPVRMRFLFKIKTFKMELHYSNIESCAGYAVDRMQVEMDGSAIVVGKLYQFVESTFTDIECDQPVVRLVPRETESNFFAF